jgi:hypothetical protein
MDISLIVRNFLFINTTLELKGNPKVAFDRVYPSEDLTRSFAQILSKDGQLSLPMNLSPELLEIFSK